MTTLTKAEIEVMRKAISKSAKVDVNIIGAIKPDVLDQLFTLALERLETMPRPIESGPKARAYNYPVNMSGLSIKVGSDGVWLNFATSKGKHASIHVRNKLGEPPERLGCINAWCDEIEEMAAQLRPIEEPTS